MFPGVNWSGSWSAAVRVLFNTYQGKNDIRALPHSSTVIRFELLSAVASISFLPTTALPVKEAFRISTHEEMAAPTVGPLRCEDIDET